MRISDWSSDVCSSDLQMRAGRALLGIDQRRLAELAGVSLPTIQRMEASDGTVRGVVDTLIKVIAAFDSAGDRKRVCRERVCQYVEISVVAVSVKKKTAPLMLVGLPRSASLQRV